jgi:hypothetical protein
LLIYSTFNILMLSSIGGHLQLNDLQNMFFSYSLSLKLKYDPISGC